jgi:hypothetical protein
MKERACQSPEVMAPSTGYQNGAADYSQRNGSIVYNVSEPTGNAEDEFLKYKSEKGGLSTSRWAPRTYDGKSKKVDGGEVWTRVCWENLDPGLLLT